MGFLKSFINDALGESAPQAFGGSNNPLATPPPPAVPRPHQPAMSVMVAVNGQSYGPYERATLLEMIDNGSLTPDTYVYINGMDNWKAASQVGPVAELFASKAPAPAVPPIPWAANPVQTGASTQPSTDGSFSPRLNSLINAAVADGEISDLERQVLIRNAQQEGVSMDEFVMVLEARLFEQQQKLNSQNRAMQPSAPAPNLQEARPTRNELRKCPACGEIIYDTTTTKCASCGYEFGNSAMAGTKGSLSAVELLHERLSQVDREEQECLKTKKSIWDDTPDFEERKENIIKSFPLPSSKADFTDLMLLCATNSQDDSDDYQDCWKIKLNQMIEKARITYADDPAIMSLVEKYAPKSKKKKFGLF